jgi:hypothetical protein
MIISLWSFLISFCLQLILGAMQQCLGESVLIHVVNMARHTISQRHLSTVTSVSPVKHHSGMVSGRQDKSYVQHGRLHVMLKINSHVALLFLPVSREISDDACVVANIWTSGILLVQCA